MKRNVLYLVLSELLLGVVCPRIGADPTPSAVFHIDGATIHPGDETVDVFVRLTDLISPAISGMQFRLKYDPSKLSATPSDVSTTPLTAGWLLVSNLKDSDTPGFKELRVVMVNLVPLTQNGQVVRITFHVLPGFTEGRADLELMPLRNLLINPSAGTATIAGPGQVTMEALEDVTAVSQLNQFSARFNRRTGEFSIMATWKNLGPDALLAPLRVFIENINPSAVPLVNADGTEGGKPFYDFSSLVGGDGALAPGETSGAKQLIFNNPNRARLTFDTRFFAVVSGGGGAAPALRPFINEALPTPMVVQRFSAVGQNFPNPFNPETWIPYELVEATWVAIDIYDAQGQLVRRLSIGHREVGRYFTRALAAYWDGRNELGERVGSGVYFYRLQIAHSGAGDLQTTRKMVISK